MARLFVAGLVCASLVAGTARAAGPDEGRRFALLVGCTRYLALAEPYQLRGPANDVVLMRALLTGRFGFPEAHVVTLAERQDQAELRPTRANIEREFRSLAAKVRQGDQVVILMAGHGSQQPDGAPDPDDPEPDGLDEIFLPADVGAWNGKAGTVANAIIDDELGAWLQAITAKGASVWITLDACHSGTMTRGVEEEVLRQVPPEQLVPAEALEKAHRRALDAPEQTRGGPAQDTPVDRSQSQSGLVAIYAAQATEPTVEKTLPPETPGAKPYGLLTYTLSQILSQTSTPITYVEVVDRVHQQYVQWGRSFPTPSIEGGERDREVLGTKRWPGRSRILLVENAGGAWRINAGALSGLTTGSVVRVHPPAGQADAVLGHVRISTLRPLDADVEAVALGDTPAPKSLPAGGRCDVVYRNYGTHPLRLAFEVLPAAGQDAAKVDELRKALTNLGDGEHPLFTWVSEPRRADWVVRVDSEKAYLVPAAGWAMRADTQRGQVAQAAAALTPSPEFGPIEANAEALRPWLEERLNRIARVQNLLALAAPEGSTALDADSSVEIHLELVKFRDRADTQGQAVPWTSAGRRLEPGDLVGFRAWNRGRTAVDVTFLFVDSGFGIKAMFPRRNTTGDNRVAPGQSVLGTRATVSATTVGLEHMVVIAVEAQGGQPPVDFGCLEQPTIEAIRTRGGEEPLDSPLGRLLKQALYAQGGTRGLDATEVNRHALRVISWQVAAQPRRDESK